MHYVINFVFSIRKQPYREAINFVLYSIYTCSINCYNDINYTYLCAYKISSSLLMPVYALHNLTVQLL